MSATDSVVVSTVVAVDPDTAFEVFTAEIDVWWKRGIRYRANASESLRFESGAGGRLIAAEASGETRELGRVLAWEPRAGRLVFEYRVRDLAPEETTEVEVRFEAVAEGTKVTLEHRGFDQLAADHPVRHGLAGQAFIAMFGTWWGDLMVSLRQHAGERRTKSADPTAKELS